MHETVPALTNIPAPINFIGPYFSFSPTYKIKQFRSELCLSRSETKFMEN